MMNENTNFENVSEVVESPASLPEQKAVYSYAYTPNQFAPCAQPKKSRKKGRFAMKVIAFVTSMAIVAVGSIEVYKYIDKNTPSGTPSNSKTVNSADKPNKNSEGEENKKSTPVSAYPSLIDLASRGDNAKSLPEIIENAMPSVVGVMSTFEVPANNFGGWDPFGFGMQQGPQEATGTGTGIIMTADGYIITNAHVIYDDMYGSGKASKVAVVFSDESKLEANIVAYDTQTDIAVLKVEAKNLKPAEFGDSNDLVVGELVVAIGNPLGFELFGSVTSGIVSALNRQITINEKKMNLIQTDAAINAGNSGGPLLNSSGQVIGINSAKMSSTVSGEASIEGLGFAIPISEAKVIIDDLIAVGYVKGRPQIGISGYRDVSESVASIYELPLGVYVMAVEKGSSADWAGIRVGDVIVGIEGTTITTIDELNNIKNTYKAGDEIVLTIYRAGENIDIPVVLQEVTANS